MLALLDEWEWANFGRRVRSFQVTCLKAEDVGGFRPWMWRGKRESRPAVFVTPANSCRVSLVTGQAHSLAHFPGPSPSACSSLNPQSSMSPRTRTLLSHAFQVWPHSQLTYEEKMVSPGFRLLMLFSGTFPSESYRPHSKLPHTSLWQYSQAHKLAALHSVLLREATAALPEQNLESSSPVQKPSVALAGLWLERGYLTHMQAAAVSLSIDKTEAHTQLGMRQHCCVLSNEG